MKKAILIFLLLGNITPAHADVYDLVNQDGSIENRIECTVEVCGNLNSLYSLLTLKPGQKYVRNDPKPVIAKETQPYEVVSKINEDKTFEIKHVEPIMVTVDTRVLKETQRTFDSETRIMTQPENAPVVKATIEIDKKIETKTPQVVDELEQWWSSLLAALTQLFAGWVWP
jgi:predicted secreted Zn-dependent protease